MEETTCPLTEGKAIEICSENFGDDCGYILENLFIKCKISAFNPTIDIINNIDIAEKTKLAGKLANFSMDYALKKGITYKVENSVNYPSYNKVINAEFLENLKQEPMPSLNERIELFLKFLRNIEKIIPTAHNHAPSGSPENMPEYTKLIQYFFFTISYTENRDWKNFIHYLKKKKTLLSVILNSYHRRFRIFKEKRKNQESKKVFVAMWFNEKVILFMSKLLNFFLKKQPLKTILVNEGISHSCCQLKILHLLLLL